MSVAVAVRDTVTVVTAEMLEDGSEVAEPVEENVDVGLTEALGETERVELCDSGSLGFAEDDELGVRV